MFIIKYKKKICSFFLFILLLVNSNYFNNFLLSNSLFKPKIFISFSPYGNTENIIINFINKASKEILLVMYNFTDKKIANSLLKAVYRGVNVKIILDGNVLRNKQKIKKYLRNTNIKFNYLYRNMHNKFIIIDNNIVGTGSYNYTFNAQNNNAENIIFLEYFPKIVNKYKKEFYRLWYESV